MDEWKATIVRCLICWKPGTIGAGLQYHHVVGKWLALRNVLANRGGLCVRCHDHLHNGGRCDESGQRLEALGNGHVFWALQEEGLFDESALKELRKLDYTPVALPSWVYQEREKHR